MVMYSSPYTGREIHDSEYLFRTAVYQRDQQQIPFSGRNAFEHVRWDHLYKILQSSEPFIRHMIAPLSVLDHGARYVEQNITAAPSVKKVLDAMKAEIQHLENLLAYFRLAFVHEIPFVEGNIKEILEQELTASMKHFRARKIAVKTELVEMPITLFCPELIAVCIRNIVKNVIDYAQSASTLTIQSRIATGDPQNYLVLQFSHPVEQCNPQDIQKACSLFYSSKKEHIGVGLSLCREIMRAMNGAVHLEALSGPAVRTTLTLPV